MSTTWIAGSLVTSTVTFNNTATGQATDPSAIVLKYRSSQFGAVTTITYPDARITRVSAGVYSAELDTTGLPGAWTVEWDGTGTVQAITPATFTIMPAPL